MTTRDTETRERLLKAAERLFADRGFKKVTVRDIYQHRKIGLIATALGEAAGEAAPEAQWEAPPASRRY